MARSSTTWAPGVSANPGGRTRDPGVEAVKAFCRSKSAEAATLVYRLMTHSASEKVQLAAALAILKAAGALRDDDKTLTVTLPAQPEDPIRSSPPGKLLEMKRALMTRAPMMDSSGESPTPSGSREN